MICDCCAPYKGWNGLDDVTLIFVLKGVDFVEQALKMGTRWQLAIIDEPAVTM